MIQSQRTMQEFRTTLPPAEVLSRAKKFFSTRNSLYAVFIEQESAQHQTYRGQGGEEIALGVSVDGGATLVIGSSYIFDMQVARFFTTLPAVEVTEILLPPPPADHTAVTA
ncbi:MAG: hypothetical protein JWL61_1106 [Gemmatimonadetes bacterium]|jgi:hypothetical protein|nr:hypothetical protein [Gemmatimonadota bacterium]